MELPHKPNSLELEASLYNPALEAHLSKDALSSLASTLKQKVGMQADMRRLQLATIMAIAGELTCPIGLGLLHDPVVIPKTGSVYSRAAITAYLNTFAKLPEHYLRDPATNIRLNQADAQQLEICGTIQTILTSLLTQVRIIEAEVSSLNDGIDAEFPQPTISADIHESPTLLFARGKTGFGTGAFMLGFAIGKEMNSIALSASVVALINTGDAILGAISEPLAGKVLDLLWHGKIVDGAHYFSVHDYHIALLMLPGYLLLAVVFLRSIGCHMRRQASCSF